MTSGQAKLTLLKAFRDLRGGWLSFTACFFTIALACCLFLAFVTASENLRVSCSQTYSRLNFLDFFLKVDQPPNALIARVRALPQVEACTARASFAANILTDPPNIPANRSRRLNGLMISTPVGSQPEVNAIHLEAGRLLAAERGEILVEKRFSEYHNVNIGDILRVERWGRISRFRVVGVVSTAEFIWLTNDRFDPRPATKRLGVGYISPADAESLGGLGRVTELHFRVKKGADREQLMDQVAREMTGFAVGHPVPRELQASNSHLLRDQRAFSAIAVIFPIVFLTLSGLILFSTMWQLVTRQRRQIGIMMAQGFSSFQLLAHFLLLGGLVGSSGGIAGAVSGVLLGQFCTRFYASTLGIPFVLSQLRLLLPLFCVTTVTGLALAAAWLAAGRILSMNPVAAIRSDFLATSGGLEHRLRWKLPVPVLMALRNLLRHPGRSLVSTLGVAFSVAQIVMTLSLMESQGRTIEFYFQSAHKFDLQASTAGPVTRGELPSLELWPEVEKVEYLLRMVIRIEHPDGELRTSVWSVPSDADLLRFYAADGQRVQIDHPQKLYLGPSMMSRIGAREGDWVSVELHLENVEVLRHRLQLVELHEPLANPPKVTASTLQHIGEASSYLPPYATNLLLLRARPGQADALRAKLEKEPVFMGVVPIDEMRAEIDSLLRVLNAYIFVMLAFTGAFALVVLMATTTMNVMERTRDLATLSCLGVGDRTLVGILMMETVALWALAMGVGIPAGYQLGGYLINNFQSELLQLQLQLSPESLLGTAGVSLFICLLAVLLSLARVGRIPLTEATQERLD